MFWVRADNLSAGDFCRGEKEAFDDLSMAHTSEVIYILYLHVKEILKG